MEALNFIRFWRPNKGGHRENRAQPSCGNNSSATEAPKGLIVSDHELDEGDDSFFDLELPLKRIDDKGNMIGQKRYESKEEQTRSLSPNDNFSKRKIIPIEANSKPESPITWLKPSPKFRVFTLRKSKSMANTNTTYTADKLDLVGLSMETPEHEKQGLSMETPEHKKQGSNKHSRVKLQIEESTNLPIFTRENSSRKTKGKKTEESLKYVMQKYLNKIKPLYVKVSKKDTKVSGDLTMSSPASSPATVFSMKEKQGSLCKQLGKSRSVSATSSPLNKRDDSLLLQHDGIQSAILHCKKSLNSSREPSRLSRCTSDSSQEKLSNASSTDSSVLSRVTSNSSYEKLMDSARISSEEGNVSSTRKTKQNVV